MADARALTTVRLLAARARARAGLLMSATATNSVAVATVTALLASLVLAVERARDAAPPGVPGEQVSAQIDAGVVALLSAAPALVLLVVVLAVTAAAQLGRLLAAARADESLTVRARGLSGRQATSADAVEAGAVALVSVGTGLALAVLATALLVGADGRAFADAPPAVLAVGWSAPLTAVVLAIALVIAGRRRADTRGRAAKVTTLAAVVVVALAAAFAVWQLRLARPTGFDPIVAIAPSAVLMAGALLALAAFAALATAWAVVAARSPAVSPSYPSREVARRLPVYAVAVLLVSLTVAQTVFASAYSATWTAMATDSAAIRAGADLRIDLRPSSAGPADVAAAADVTGVRAAAPALVASIEIGGTTGELVAVPTAAIKTVVSAAGGAVDLSSLTDAVTPHDGTVTAAPLALGESATALRVEATAQSSRTGAAEGVQLSATLVDAAGTPITVRLDTVGIESAPDAASGAPVAITAETELPDGTAPWSLLALHAAIPASFASVDVVVDVVAVEAVDADALEVGGRAELNDDMREQVLWRADEEASDAEPGPVRAALGTTLAERLGLSVGDVFEFRYAGTGRRGEIAVAAVIDAVPGASTGLSVFVPLEVLTVSMLQRGTSIVRPTSVWAAGDTASDAALSAVLGDRPVATSVPGVAAGIVGGLVPGWWIAVAGSAVLSLIAAFAIVQTLALARRRELGVIRALGVTSARQARMRAAELAGVLGTAVVLGAAAGVFVSWLTVSELVRAVTPGILPLSNGMAIAWPPMLIALSLLAAGLAVIVAMAATGVARAALYATVGEDAR